MPGKLLRLEIFNFKSYKGHHVLLFGDSFFTSIIGPNGSGKSNSMDAISFVLGVKSRQLRSAAMDELIYRGRILRTNPDGSTIEAEEGVNGHTNGVNGTADTVPSGSQRHDPKSAWVMAVYLDDSGVEHRWKRTVTRSGSSEYRINDRVVTVQRYNEALESERILIKAKNFLVPQGTVEGVAAQDAKDLTRLVEQISGSLEYKAEYERIKAEKEEADTDQAIKLNERRAINSEIKQYQEQKRVADEFNAKVEERDQARINQVMWKLYHCQRRINEADAEIQRYQDEHKEQRRSVQKYQEQVEEAQRQHAKASRDVAKVQKSIGKREKEIEEVDFSLTPVNAKLQDSMKHLDDYKDHMAKVISKRDTVSREVDKLKKDLETVKKAQRRWEDEWKKTAQKEGRELSDADLREYTRLRSEVMKRSAADQSTVSSLGLQQRTNEDTVKSLKSQVDSAQAHVEKFEKDMAEFNERRQELKSEIERAKASITDRKQKHAEFTSGQVHISQKLTEANEKLMTTLKEINESDGTRRENEKERQTKETITAMKRVFDKSVFGRLSDLCKPKQKKYEIAVSTILGKHFDSVVVDTNETSRACIEYLRERRVGVMTFLPLDTLQVHNVDSSLKGMHRGMHLAIDTIEYSREVERAMAYACGNSMVCDNDRVARELIDEKNVRAKAVTLEGKIWHTGGKITGGRSHDDQRSTQRWDAQKYDKLIEQKERYLRQCQELKTKLRDDSEGIVMQAELREFEVKLQGLLEEQKATDRNINSKKKELAHVKEQLKDAQPKYKEHSAGLEKLKARIDQHKASIDRVADDVFAAFCQRLGYANIRDYEAQQGSLEEQAREKKREFTQQRQKLETQLRLDEQRLQDVQTRVETLQNRLEREQSTLAGQEAEKETLDARKAELEAEVEELNSQLDGVRDIQKEKEHVLNAERQELQKRKKGLTKTFDSIEELKKDIQSNSAERFSILKKCKIDQIKIPLTDDSKPLDSLPLDDVGIDEDAMDVDDPDASVIPIAEAKDFGIEPDFDELDDELKDDTSSQAETKLEEIITTLSRQIESSQPNMRANSRLADVEARLTTTEKAYEASRQAANRAARAFTDVQEQRLELFQRALTHISEAIGPIYKELTRSANFAMGGQAYLDAEDADEPYLAGIKYHAMPPLKRFRDMEHLSGGEKTIAALALLFAIHSFQPSPFFVLDEVDAALDNINVARVAKYVRDHAGPGMQFIVISLKTGFFQESESLVGVMRDQSDNSSKVLTLDLRKYQEPIPVR